MDGIELTILTTLRDWYDADGTSGALIRLVSSNFLFKGVIAAALIWGMWMQRQVSHILRCQLIAVAAIGVIALVVGRLLANALPFRLRPRFEPALNYVAMPDDGGLALDTWSSMPSDHAVMYFALGTGLFLVNRAVGSLALLHALVFISLPRIGLGLHYPSDILVGAATGVFIALTMFRPLTNLADRAGIVPAFERQPAVMYPLMFLATFQIASNFQSLRALMSVAATLVKRAL